MTIAAFPDVREGQVWRRKNNGFEVKITEVEKAKTGRTYFTAHNRLPGQPARGSKQTHYFREDFVLVEDVA